MSDWAKAFCAGLFAMALWGVSPILYRSLAHVPPSEVLAHRTIWSLLIIFAFLCVNAAYGGVFVNW